MYEVLPCSHVGAPEGRARGSTWLLEDSDGVAILRALGRDICFCPSKPKKVWHDDKIDDVGFSWEEMKLGSVVFHFATTMLWLHGATLQQLFTPFILLSADPRPDSHPIPGAESVLIASVPPHVLSMIPLPELFSHLRSGAALS